MVIGHGLVASGFKAYHNNDRCLIFASGVSNSSNPDPDSFLREARLLQQMIDAHKDKIFVYFGTCSIYDHSMQHSTYVMHKLTMETMIQEQHDDYHIFRISNLVGKINNPNTVLNFFIRHIQSGSFFQLWKNAYRNIIDLDDAVAVCNYIIKQQLCKNEIVNVANPVNYTVLQIVEAIEAFTQKKGNYELVNKGGNPIIDTNIVQNFFDALNIHFDDSYLSRMFRKYFQS